MLDFETFARRLFDGLGLEAPSRLEPETYFVEDLDFDSLRMLQLLLVLEELGIHMTEEKFRDTQALDDAYFYYVQSRERDE